MNDEETTESNPEVYEWPKPLEGESRPLSRLAFVSLLCGSLSLIGFVPLGVVGVVLGVISRKRLAKDSGFKGKGVALLGLILSVIGVAVWIAILAVIFIQNDAELTRLFLIKDKGENGDPIVMQHPSFSDSFYDWRE